MVDERTSDLIARIYTGVHDLDEWNLAMEEIGDRMHAAFLMVGSIESQSVIPSEIGYYRVKHSRFDEAVTEYASEMHRFDPTLSHIANSYRGAQFDSLDLVPAAEYDSHPYVQWNMDRCGSKYWKMMHKALPGGAKLAVSVHRGAELGPLSRDDSQLLKIFFSHMANAIDLASVPPILSCAEALLFVKGHAELVTCNEAADTLLSGASEIRSHRGRLYASDRASDLALKAAIALAASRVFKGETPLDTIVPIHRVSDGPALLARVTSLPRPAAPFNSLGAAVMLRIIDPDDRPKSPSTLWRAAFGFTASENRLVDAMLDNEGSLRDAAERLGIAYGTARVHLARIFSKAGVSSQSSLIRLLSRLGT